MQKVYKSGQECPFGKKCVVDSLACRQCDKYYGASGCLFIRCDMPAIEQELKPVVLHESLIVKKKPGRKPKNPEAEKEPKKVAKKKVTKKKVAKKTTKPKKV